MALSSKRVPDWWLAATKHVIGDNSLPDAMVLAFAEIGWRSAWFLAGSGTDTTRYDLEALIIEIPIDWKCTLCRCPAKCSCCDEKFCGCSMESVYYGSHHG